MDQDLYYSTNLENDVDLNFEFNNFLKQNNLEFLDFLEKNTKDIKKDDDKVLIDHIYNLHLIILDEIKKKGINNKFLYELKREITNYNKKAKTFK